MSDPDVETEATAPVEAPTAAPAAHVAAAADPPADSVAVGGAETVNPQMIDTLAVVEAAVADPALAGASLAQVKAQAAGLALLNAVNAQQNAYVTANATVLAAVARILAVGGRADVPTGEPGAQPPNVRAASVQGGKSGG